MGLLEGVRGLVGVIGPMVGAACYKWGGGRAPAAFGGIFQVIAWILACLFLKEEEDQIESDMKSSSRTNALVNCAEKDGGLDSLMETKKSR